MRDSVRRRRDGTGEAWQAMDHRKSWHENVLGGYRRRGRAEAAERHVDDHQHAKLNDTWGLRDQARPALPIGNMAESAVTALCS